VPQGLILLISASQVLGLQGTSLHLAISTFLYTLKLGTLRPPQLLCFHQLAITFLPWNFVDCFVRNKTVYKSLNFTFFKWFQFQNSYFVYISFVKLLLTSDLCRLSRDITICWIWLIWILDTWIMSVSWHWITTVLPLPSLTECTWMFLHTFHVTFSLFTLLDHSPGNKLCNKTQSQQVSGWTMDVCYLYYMSLQPWSTLFLFWYPGRRINPLTGHFGLWPRGKGI
jgi:hypothetical protein